MPKADEDVDLQDWAATLSTADKTGSTLNTYHTGADFETPTPTPSDSEYRVASK